MRPALLLRAVRPILLAAAFLAAACSTSAPTQTDHHDANAHPTQPVRLAQLGYGHQAVFRPCADADCPQRTHKTIPTAAASIAPASLPTDPPTVADAPLDGLAPRKAIVSDTREPAPLREHTIAIRFPFGSAQLTPAALHALRELSPRLDDAHSIRIEGRTDSVGPPAANERLATERARAVHDALLALAPSLASRMAVAARGHCCFIASNGEATGRALNRRVEITSVHPPEDPP